MARRAIREAPDLDGLVTEAWNPETADLDVRSTGDLVALMSAEEARVPPAVAAAQSSIAEAIDAIVGRLSDGGRLVYVGAGTSGRLAAVDAAECATTSPAGTPNVVSHSAASTAARRPEVPAPT